MIPGADDSARVSMQAIAATRPLNPTDALYLEQLIFSGGEENKRRASRVSINSVSIEFEKTPMGRVRYVIDPQTGFVMRVLGTLLAEISSGKRSGAHRHLYEEVNYVIYGSGYTIIEDRRYDWSQGDVLCIPVFSWHQHFNTREIPARFLVHHNRPLMENLGFMHMEQGEWSDE
jgi:gentisate 1,2-dioxygenase